MIIDHVVSRGSPAVYLKAETDQVLTAETAHDGIVQVDRWEIHGVHSKDAEQLAPGRLEDENLEILSQYVSIDLRPADEPSKSVTNYSIGATGLEALIIYQNPSGRGKVCAVASSLSES